MMEKGILEISKDGKNWNEVKLFEFGNLINDPTTRTHRFKKKIVPDMCELNLLQLLEVEKLLQLLNSISLKHIRF